MYSSTQTHPIVINGQRYGVFNSLKSKPRGKRGRADAVNGSRKTVWPSLCFWCSGGIESCTSTTNTCDCVKCRGSY